MVKCTSVSKAQKKHSCDILMQYGHNRRHSIGLYVQLEGFTVLVAGPSENVKNLESDWN